MSAHQNEWSAHLADVWGRAEAILRSNHASARFRIDRKNGGNWLTLIGLAEISPHFRSKPILHLDATLRSDIASKVLPGLVSQSVEAAASQMSVHMIAGRFGKSRIVPDAKAGADENQRRLGHLQACVDYVRWHVRRLTGRRILVITHKAVEEHFAIDPQVATGHFNAMAGLDVFGDVAAIFIIGRPLPSDVALRDPTAALFDVDMQGGYRQATAGIRMRDGSTRCVKVTRHSDPKAEPIRAAICDDELIQCLGRGRGVNRTEDDPLEVHTLRVSETPA